MEPADAVPVARQIAEALEAAHDQGIVHRDLKPANIKVRGDGTVKVLDFGVAKALDAPAAGAMSSPTMTSPAMMTRAGIILGTAAYMAPEQAKGQLVDKRADIWAFGCVLFEMLAGRPLFVRETVTETLASVLRDAPQIDALPPDTPPHVRRLLARCLERDPRQRLRDIGEARIALGAATDVDSSQIVSQPRAIARRSVVGRVTPWAIATLAIAAAVAAWIAGPRADPRPLRKLEVSLDGVSVAGPVISPDGKRIAFLADGHLRVKDLNQVGSRDIGAVASLDRDFIFWSPDSASLGYATADGKLWKVPATGGAPILLCTIPETGRLMGAAWRPDGRIVMAAWQGSLYQVPSTGGTPTLLAAIDPAKETDFHFPVIAPDGRVLVTTHLQASNKERPSEGYRVEMLDEGQRQTVLEAASFQLVAFLDPGYLLVWRYDQASGLWALPFSSRLPLRIDDAFMVAPGARSASAARDGTLMYSVGSNAARTNELVWTNRAGEIAGQIAPPQPELNYPALSPDGRRIAFSARVGDHVDLWVRDVARGVQSRITFDPTDKGVPVWFPSGQRLVYSESGATSVNQIVASSADGSGHRQELTKGLSPSVSDDGHYIVYLVEERGALRLRYSALAADGTAGPAERVFKTAPEPNVAGVSRVSPDGGFLAYNERQPTGEFEVFVTRFPSGEGRWQISTGGGRMPRWIRETRELVFVSGAAGGPRQMTSVPIAFRPAFVAGPPAKLFDLGAELTASVTPTFDVAPDGQRFLMVRTRAESGARSTARWVLVQNWRAEFPSR